MKKTFIFYSDWIDYTQEMSREEKWLFLEAILAYQNWETLWDLWPIKFVWSRVKKQLDEDNKKWSDELVKRAKAGKEWWLAKASKWKQVLASASKWKQLLADNDNDNDNVNENVNENENDNIISSKEDKEQALIPEKKEYWNKEINEMLNSLRVSVGVKDFKEPSWTQRIYAKHLVNLYRKIWKDEFMENLKGVLYDPFKRKNSNSLKYLYGELKSFVRVENSIVRDKDSFREAVVSYNFT